MTDLNLSLKINALVKGVKEVEQLAGEIKKLTSTGGKPVADPTKPIHDGARKTTGVIQELQGALAGLVTLGAIANFVKSSVRELFKAESAFKGLESVANYTGVGIGRAFQEAQKLTADGLVGMADASKALQNLLSRGYDVDQAVAVLNRLKDSAAFNRAAHLSLSEAVVTASEGLKNENSILVDNAGVTKNVSVMWKDYAETIGKSVNDLTQAEKIQAEYNGIMQETEAQLGNAAKAANGLQGEQAKLTKSSTELKVAFATGLTPALTKLAEGGKWIINNFIKPFLGGIEIAAIKVGFLGQALGHVLDAIRNRTFSGLGDRIKADADLADEMALDVVKRYEEGTVKEASNPKGGADEEKRKRFQGRLKGGDKNDKQATARFNLLKAAQEAELALQKDHLTRMQADYDYMLERNLVSFKHYYDARIDIQQRAIDDELAAKRSVLAGAQQIAATNKDEGKRLEAMATVKKLGAEITVLEKQRGDVAVQARRDQVKAEEGLANTLSGVRARVLSLQGNSGEARTIELENEFKDLLKRLNSEGDQAGADLVKKLIDVETAKARLDQIQSSYDLIAQRQQNREQSIDIDRKNGLITETQAREKLRDLHRETAAELEKLIPDMERLAAATGNPQSVENVRRMKEEVRGLKVETNEAANVVNGSIQDGFANIFKDVSSGAKSAKQIMLDFLGSIGKAMEDLLAKRFAEQLYGTMFSGNSSSGGGIGGFFSAMFGMHHTGGIAGSPSQSRSMSPAVFLGAPRYHSGGIAGLAPDEVPAILQRGEEVLTKDDARHRNNQGAGNTYNVSVAVDASGSRVQGDAGNASELGRRIEGAVRRVLVDEKRPGGLLAS